MSGHHFDWRMILSVDICMMSIGKIDEQAIILLANDTKRGDMPRCYG